MSRTFYIKNSQAPKVMTTREILELQKGKFTHYEIYEDEADLEEFLNMPINECGYLLIGQDGISGRGFEVAYEEEIEEYSVRVFTPSTEADWLGAFEFIKNLAQYLKVQVVDEEDFVYDADNITFDYRKDIEAGIKAYTENDEDEKMFLFGVNRPVCFGAEIVQKLQSSENKVEDFSKFVEYQQYLDGLDHYVANPLFYGDEEDNIFGAYVLTEGVVSVLPYEHPPFIDITKYSIEQEQIKEWSVILVENSNDFSEIGKLNYQTFLERLPQEKIKKLDGHYMLIELSKEEMKSLL
ncbi:MAG: DUF4299 family protein [Flavobacteriaceae bacterium]|nr:DUF4299 family protein [Flavobacteriaceae bacterium]